MSPENGPSEAGWSGLQMATQHLCPQTIPNLTSTYAPRPSAPQLTEDPLHKHLGSFSNSNNDVDSDATPLSNSPKTPSLSNIAENFPYTLDWIDYSNTPNLPFTDTIPEYGKIPPSSNLPLASPTSPPTNRHSPTNSSSPPSTNPFTVTPSCTCLPDLYLTLSNLSTLPSLPVNPNTVEILQTATRTAHSVLYCPTCPPKFQSGMQNVMLLATLLAVIGDGWSRILRAPAKDLARGFDVDPTTSLCSDSDLADSWTDAKEMQWKLFARYLTRQYVFGDAPPPGIHLPGICPFLFSTSPAPPSIPPIIILQNLCDAMERRQKTWHGLIEATGEFPHACGNTMEMARLGGGDCTVKQRQEKLTGMEREGKEHLCLKIVQLLRAVLKGVDRRPERGERSWEQARVDEILGR